MDVICDEFGPVMPDQTGSTMKVKPVNDHILVKLLIDQKTPGGIALPTNYQPQTCQAIVVETCEQLAERPQNSEAVKVYRPSQYKRGQIVIVDPSARRLDVLINGEQHALVWESSICGVIEE